MTKSRGIYKRNPFDRLMERVELVPATGCLAWSGSVNHHGYGRIYDHRVRKYVTIHRLAYMEAVGPIAEGLQIDHLCRNRRCVNPEHLEPVTALENIRRKPESAKCPQGHGYTPENTYQRPDRPGKMCRTCVREAGRRFHERKAATALER